MNSNSPASASIAIPTPVPGLDQVSALSTEPQLQFTRPLLETQLLEPHPPCFIVYCSASRIAALPQGLRAINSLQGLRRHFDMQQIDFPK